jgi:hypothetical protein
MSLSKSIFLLTSAAAFLAMQGAAHAHGFAGDRFFPATLTTDDPFVAAELSLPTVSTIITPDDGGTRETDLSFDVAFKITDNFGLEIGETFTKLEPPEGRALTGWNNLEIGGKYQFFVSEKHETILSLGLNAEIGGTGRKLIGADTFTTWTPGLFFGKGFGDLPNCLNFLKPLAITGSVGLAIPSSARSVTFSRDPDTGEREMDIEEHPNTLEWGFAVEYSLIHLQSHVKDIGLRAPFDRLIPLVEFSFETPLDRGSRGETTGTINPGIIWSGKYCQLGAEAVIPVNSRTGSNVGMIFQLHFYLDDLLPRSLGRPLFGSK